MKINNKLFTVGFFLSASIFLLTYTQHKSRNPSREDFEIESTIGHYKLEQDRGKVVIVYFGYRFCPDVCPMTLSDLASIRKKMTDKEKKIFNVIFISLDPSRDTLLELKEYVSFFDSSFIAATASREELDKIAKKYDVKYKIYTPENNSPNSYSVDHSAEAFIVGKDGSIKDIILYKENT